MSSGIAFAWFGDEPVPWPDLAQEMLRRPTCGPGSVFQYTDASTYVAMRMLGAAVGDVRDWLMPRLLTHSVSITRSGTGAPSAGSLVNCALGNSLASGVCFAIVDSHRAGTQ